jgi:hypothetical protein
MLIVSKKWLSLFAVVFFFDQMLLPMFHFGGVPIKVSYLILIFMFLVKADFGLNNKIFFKQVLFSKILFMTTLVFGLLFFNTITIDSNFTETIRMLLVFILSLGSLKLGLLASNLSPKYLTITLIGVMVLIALLVFAPEAVPIISNMWWKTSEQFQEMVTQNELRPTPFGDGSGVRVNILLLGLTLLYVHKLYDVNFKWILWISVLIINIILGSRNQFVVFIGYSLFLFLKNKEIKAVMSRVLIVILSVILILPVFIQFTSSSSVFKHTLERIGGIFKLLDSSSDDNDVLSRPLLMFDSFRDRFIESPIFGSSFDLTDFKPFNYLHFHNDWLLLLVSTGVLGFLIYASIVFKIYKKLGIVAIFPFFLPGLTNSFIWAIPSYLVYFFLIGYVSIKREKLI